MSQWLSWGHLGLHYRSSLSHSVSQQHICVQYHQRLCWGMPSWWMGWSYSQSVHARLYLQYLSLRRWLNCQLRVDLPWFPWPLCRPHQPKMRLDLSQLPFRLQLDKNLRNLMHSSLFRRQLISPMCLGLSYPCSHLRRFPTSNLCVSLCQPYSKWNFYHFLCWQCHDVMCHSMPLTPQ